jgi:hypothetical protein
MESSRGLFDPFDPNEVLEEESPSRSLTPKESHLEGV